MNANDQLREYNCSDNYYRFGPLLLTDGIKALCERFECWWVIDIIASYQPQLKDEEFQVWKLVKNEDDSALITCENGNGIILKKQKVAWTDFTASECTVWIEAGEAWVCLLPSEH